MADLADTIKALLPKADGDPAAMITLARMMRKAGQHAEAAALCQKAARLGQGNPEIAVLAADFLAGQVHDWHFSLLQDARRNQAYDTALKRAIRPGDRVLEIGTGSGILAMMAARAGAADVVTCEMNPTVAMLAREVIAANGYDRSVRVVGKHSQDLALEADLGGPADILVSEIVDNTLLAENVLDAHDHAVRRLLKPGAKVIPAQGTIRIALAEDSACERLTHAEGFDFSAFAKAGRPKRIAVTDPRLSLRSEAYDLFRFDFAGAAAQPPSRTEIVCRSEGGRVDGVVQWIHLQLDAETEYENRPRSGEPSCWAAVFHPFPATRNTTAGEQIRVFAAHDRQSVWLWTEP